MRISKIAPSRHKDGRWLIWLEDGSLLRVGEAEMLDFSLHAGLELDDAAAEAQLAEADELLTAVLFVPTGGKFFRFLVIVKVFAGFCLRTRKKMV